MTAKLLDPIHPGEILLNDFLLPMGISINRLAREIAVPPGRVSSICQWAPRNHRRYRFTAGQVFRRVSRNLDGAAGRLRPACDPPGHRARAELRTHTRAAYLKFSRSPA